MLLSGRSLMRLGSEVAKLSFVDVPTAFPTKFRWSDSAHDLTALLLPSS